MKTVKINAKGAGKWADPDTTIPQIEVVEGDIVDVSDELADMMCPNCGEIVADVAEKTPEPEKETPKVVMTTGKEKPAVKDKKAATRKPAVKDKKAATRKPAVKDKDKAESK